ncbi:MAG: agmatine deiminase family protein [Bacteroidaceae bacterium]|nr:agmatine deiminase family protein [Bacteroidaceae bacterium]
MGIHYKLTTTIIEDLTKEIRPERLAGPEQNEIRATHLPAEWAMQSGVQLTWPHKATDWAPTLKEVTECYIHMALEISLRERLIIVTPEPDAVGQLLNERLPKRALANISLHNIPSNDTWARDHGFITLKTSIGALLLDFQFNGWGKKFTAELDNQINRNLVEQGVLNGQYEDHLDFVLEGGSIECDGRGTIMTTSKCLLAPNRNQPLSQAEIEDRLKRYLRVERVLWLDYGYLAGDDTDSHIDTLARLCPNDTIAYVQCLDKDDEHYEELKKMEEQLLEFRTLEGKPYQLIPLPMAEATYDEDGMRLPATYANFLCINGAVLMPTYGCPRVDEQARQQLQQAFPKHEIVPVDCRILIEQHGSLHCSAMQFPIGVVPPPTPSQGGV